MVEEIFKSQYTIEEKIISTYNLLITYLRKNGYNLNICIDESYSISDNDCNLVLATLKKELKTIVVDLTTPNYYFGKSLSNIITKFENDHNTKEDNIKIIICLSGR